MNVFDPITEVVWISRVRLSSSFKIPTARYIFLVLTLLGQ